jgi:hypothetical protein
MINTKRPPINYHCTHAQQQVAKVIDWMEGLAGGGRTLPESWNAFTPAPPYVLAANQAALSLAVNFGKPVILAHTQLKGFELVRRLMLEASYPHPGYFANSVLMDSDFSRLTQLGKQIVDSPFHLWEPMELNAEELYEWLAMFCDETGVQTVVVDDPLMFSSMSGNQSWVKLANHLNVEMLLFRPIEASGSMEI